MRLHRVAFAIGGVLAGLMALQTAAFLRRHTCFVPTVGRCVFSSMHRASVRSPCRVRRFSGSTTPLLMARHGGHSNGRGRMTRLGVTRLGVTQANRCMSRQCGNHDFGDDVNDGWRDRGESPTGAIREMKPQDSWFPVQVNKAFLIGLLALGIGAGITMESALNTNPRDLASRVVIDRRAPNPNICQMYGSSAMVVDQRVFITFNPFTLHVSQADTKPGCVLLPANADEVLRRTRNLLTPDDIESCKAGSNTWGFVGDLDDNPQLSCVYQSDDAQNEYLSDPKHGLGEDPPGKHRAAAANKVKPQEAAKGLT